MRVSKLFFVGVISIVASQAWADGPSDAWVSKGRTADPTAKSLTEIREAEKRLIPLDVMLQMSQDYAHHQPVQATIIVTNLFDKPLLMNSRMLVNHPKLEGELVFSIIGPDGKRCDIQRLITPMAIRDDDFVVLPRGQSIQRTVDLSDLYGLTQKGTYKVKAYYHNDVDQPMKHLRAWKGVAASDTMEFRIR